MTDFEMVAGFEDVWRPPIQPRRRTPETVLQPTEARAAVRARLMRLVSRAPEVMLKVTGRTRDAGGLLAHLNYISRKGGLEVEDRDGAVLSSRQDVRQLADDWSSAAARDGRRRAGSPVSVSIVLSMPAATNAIAMRDAARSFAREAFGERFDYVFVLHTDAAHPHVHLAVRALGDDGCRLNPKKADLAAWREALAQALRDCGVAAEATPRRARGVTRKAERAPLRRLRERQEAGLGPHSMQSLAALTEASHAAFQGNGGLRPWEAAIVRRQSRVRALYRAQAALLALSPNSEDRDLARLVEAYVTGLPAPDTRRLELARALRSANARQLAARSASRDRGR